MADKPRPPGKSRAARYVLGRRLGERHPRAILSDHEVELVRQLRDENPPMPFKEIAEKFEVSVRCIEDIVYFNRRRGMTVEDI